MTKEKDLKSYAIRVKGESLTDWSGAVPENIEALIKKPSKDTATLLYQIVKTQVELLCQQGKTVEAMEALEKYREQEHVYSAPLCTFKRDNQNGQAPYQGAHCFYGAFRDAAGALFELYYKKAADRGMKASDKHLRKYVRIIPNHIFLYRDGKKILKPDLIEGQQPVDDVRGFARYEVIRHPFSFNFAVQVFVAGPFKEFLADKSKVMEALYSATLNGEGSRRSAGYGGWKITDMKVEDWAINE